MSAQNVDDALETFVSEAPGTTMLILFNALSYWLSETIPSTLPQRRDIIYQTSREVGQRAHTFIDQACDEQGRCTTDGYRRRAHPPDRARPHANVIDAQKLTQSIVNALKQHSREQAIDYLGALIGGWCLCCPASLAQPYLIDGQDPTDAGIARSLLEWTLRPLSFWD
jgi:hypothetical protein